MTQASTGNYWISNTALSITLNALGEPDRIQGSAASGAVIMCYIRGIDGLGYDNGHNYKRWNFSCSPTVFGDTKIKYVCVAIPRPTADSNVSQDNAFVCFPSEVIDLYGQNEGGTQVGSTNYYYINLGGIIASSIDETTGDKIDRVWSQTVNYGTLATDEAIAGGGADSWWQYSSVDNTIQFLKTIADATFNVLRLSGGYLNKVATYLGLTDDDEHAVVTTHYLQQREADIEKKYLRKDQDDTDDYKLTLNKLDTTGEVNLKDIVNVFSLLQSNGFVDSMTAGKGWGVDASGNMQVESLEVRSALRVLELVYNRLSAEESEYVFTESGTIESVSACVYLLDAEGNDLLDAEGNAIVAKAEEDVSSSEVLYICELKKRSDTDFNAFRKGDILRAIVNNLENMGDRSEYYTIWMRVEDVDVSLRTDGDVTSHNNTIVITLYDDTAVPSGKNYSIYPLSAPVVVQRWGNVVEPSEEAHNNEDYASFIEQNSAGTWINRRQSCWYISSIEKRICMLDGVDKPKLSNSNYAAFFGLPTNFEKNSAGDWTFMDYTLNPLQPYLYCRGAFLQDIHYIDYNGVVMKMENPRGNWSAAIAAGDTPYMNTDTYYDTAYHNNAKWQCAESKTTDIPGSGSGWVLLEAAVSGSTPTITDGYWYIDGKSTGVKATGENGETPYIGTNKHWWIGTSDTGVVAEGENGATPTIGENGNWFINGEDTGRTSVGDDGKAPYIADDGYWYEYDAEKGEYTNTGVTAKGESSLIASLTNEFDTIPLNSKGYCETEQIVVTTLEMYYGTSKQALTFLAALSSDSDVEVNVEYEKDSLHFYPSSGVFDGSSVAEIRFEDDVLKYIDIESESTEVYVEGIRIPYNDEFALPLINGVYVCYESNSGGIYLHQYNDAEMTSENTDTKILNITEIDYDGDSYLPATPTGKVSCTFPTETGFTAGAKIAITGTCSKGTQSADFVVRAIKAAKDGESPIIYQLNPSLDVIKKDKNDSYQETILTCSIVKREGDTYTEGVSYGTLKMRIDSSSELDYKAYSAITLATTKPTKWVDFVLYDTSNNVIDKERVNVVKDGADGTAVTITNKEVMYALSSGGSESDKPSESSWQSTIPTAENGNYLWTRTSVTYSDGNVTTAYSVSRMGIDGKGVQSSVVDYYVNAANIDPTTIASTSWGSFPSAEEQVEGYWLYTRSRVTYSDGNVTTSYSVAQIGTGSSYAGVSEYYALGASSTEAPGGSSTYPSAGTHDKSEDTDALIKTPWSTTHPTEDDTKPENNSGVYKPYLWNFEISRDSGGTKYVTAPMCIGNYSKGIVSVVETYAISAESVLSDTVKDLTWTDEQADAAPTEEKKYQWNKTVTTYTNGTTDTFYHVSAVKGANGSSAPLLTLAVNRQIIECENDWSPVVSEDITFTATLQNLTGNVDSWTVKGDGETYDSSKYSISGNVLKFQDVENFCKTYSELEVTAIKGTLSDTVTIACVRSGSDGKDAYTAILTNESHTFAATSDGKAIASSADCGIIAYKGATQIAATIGTISGLPTGLTAAISNNGTTSASIKFTASTSMTSTSGSVTIPLTIDNKSFTKTFSYALSVKGATGDSSVAINIDNQMDSLPCDSNGKVVSGTSVSCVVYVTSGTTVVATTAPTAANIKLFGVTPTISTSGNKHTITWAFTANLDASSANRIIATIPLTYNSITYNAVFTLSVVRSGAAGVSPTIYNLQPSISSVSFARQSDNTLSPASYSVGCGYVKKVGNTTTVYAGTSQSEVMSIDGTYNIFYRFKNSDGTYGSWSWLKDATSYKVTIASSTSYIALEFAMSSSSAVASIADTNIIDRQSVGINKDGSNGSNGVNGADGVQANLYGYDNYVNSGQGSVVHTKTGLASLLTINSDGNSYINIFKDADASTWTNGTALSIHCTVKITNVSGLTGTAYVSLSAEGTVKGGTASANIASGGSADLSLKTILTKDFQPYLYIKGNASALVIVEVTNLKVEYAENLLGIYTPFDSLASDSIASQENNILVDSYFGSSAKWSTYNGSQVANMYEGHCGLKFSGTVAAEDTTDIIEQDLTGKLSADTWYTFSFYAKNDNTNLHLYALISGGVVCSTANVQICNNVISRSSSRPTIYIYDSKMTAWNRYVITFKTASTVPSNVYMLMYLENEDEDNDYSTNLCVCMPKLEKCERATNWCLNEKDNRGASIRVSSWTKGQTYYSGDNGEPYQDIVICSDYSNEAFLCKYTHTANDTNKPSDSTTKRTSGWDADHPWVASDVQEFVATKVLLAQRAKIENLYVDVLDTEYNGLRTEISGGTFNVYGSNNNVAITIQLDDSGMPHLIFNDSEGNKLYDLGPEGLSDIKSHESYFSSIDFLSFVANAGLYVQNLTTIVNMSKVTLYKFYEGYSYINGAKVYYVYSSSTPSEYNGRVYHTNTFDDASSSKKKPNTTGISTSDSTGYYVKSSVIGMQSSRYVYETAIYSYSAGDLTSTLIIRWTTDASGNVKIYNSNNDYATTDSDGNTITTTTSLFKCAWGKVS